MSIPFVKVWFASSFPWVSAALLGSKLDRLDLQAQSLVFSALAAARARSAALGPPRGPPLRRQRIRHDPLPGGEGEQRRSCRSCAPIFSPLTIVSYGINAMSERETINGTPVTEEQIAAWAGEAEAGYDVSALKKRGRGRPGRGAEPSQVIALRLTADEISALDGRAEREGKSRSEVIREALASA